jgi:hypothetical protein
VEDEVAAMVLCRPPSVVWHHRRAFGSWVAPLSTRVRSLAHIGSRANSPGNQSSLAMWSTAARTAIASFEHPIRPIADQGDCQGMSPVRRARLADDREAVPHVIGNLVKSSPTPEGPSVTAVVTPPSVRHDLVGAVHGDRKAPPMSTP